MRISKRDNAIIEFVHRHCCVPYSVLRSKFFAELTVNAAIQVAGRLCRHGYLNSYPLVGSMKYFRLGRSAVRSNPAYRVSQTKKLPPAPLRVEFGALSYCFDSGQHRLTPREVQQLYPKFPEQLLWKHPYYVHEEAGAKRLTQIRVEVSASPRNIIKKHKQNLYRINDTYPEFRKMFDNDELMLVVISPSEVSLYGKDDEDKSSLSYLLQAEQWYPRCHLFACPDLKHFPS